MLLKRPWKKSVRRPARRWADVAQDLSLGRVHAVYSVAADTNERQHTAHHDGDQIKRDLPKNRCSLLALAAFLFCFDAAELQRRQ